MNGGNGIWKIATDALLALDQTNISVIFYDNATYGELLPDGTFALTASTVLTATESVAVSLDGILAIDPADARSVGNFGGDVTSVPAPETTGWNIGSMAIVKTDIVDAGDALLFFWNLNTPLVVPELDQIHIPSGDLSFYFL